MGHADRDHFHDIFHVQIMIKEKIILASKSPRRSQILQWAEVDFEIMAANTDESFPEGLPAVEVAAHIAAEKARAVRSSISSKDRIILAADTIVVLGDRIIGKPEDRSHAIEILEALSGNTHNVITGVCILAGEKEIIFSDSTEVVFHLLTRQQIEYYIDKYQPYDKAGAYAIQEWIGVTGIQAIKGDFYNVMGLPVSRVVKALSKL